MQRANLAGLLFSALQFLSGGSAWAHGGYGGYYRGGHYGGYYGGHPYRPWGFHGGPGTGVYLSPGWPYYPGYVYSPPVVAVPASPPVYLQRDLAPPAAPIGDNYWYYCPAIRGYYPDTQQCPGGWQQLIPEPPPQ